MTYSKDHIDAVLNKLATDLPAMVALHPDPGVFWPIFAGATDLLLANAGTLLEYTEERLDDMLAAQGLWSTRSGHLFEAA